MHTSWLSISFCFHSLNTQTRTWIRLLGPCFKTGQIRCQVCVIAKDTHKHKGCAKQAIAKLPSIMLKEAWSQQSMLLHHAKAIGNTSWLSTCRERHTAHREHIPMLRHMHPLIEPCTQQPHMTADISFALLPTISGTFNSLFKGLFTFPARYLFAVVPNPTIYFRRSLPPILHSTAKEHDS